MSGLTLEHVAAIMPLARANGLAAEFESLLTTLRRYEITTKNRVAAFLANVAKESGELYYVEEIASGEDYEWRSDLGNFIAGDGVRFKGHGYIQVTGRANHGTVGAALGVDAIGDPEILSRMPFAWYSAGWYWRYGSSWGNLNDYADEGDFGSTVLGVRGGEDDDRWRYWYAALEVLPDDLAIGEEAVTEFPTIEAPERLITPAADGWYVDSETGIYTRVDARDSSKSVEVNARGWLFDPAAGAFKPGGDAEETSSGSDWEWPEAWDEPIPNSSNYQERHPTRYFWRPDVESWARYLVNNFDAWCNTYEEHPEGFGYSWVSRDESGIDWYYQNTSIDVWGPAGRNDWIDSSVGDEIFNLLFYHEGAPNISWIIFKRYIYGAWNGWNGEYFGDGSVFTNHDDHIHVSYL